MASAKLELIAYFKAYEGDKLSSKVRLDLACQLACA